MRRFSSLMLAAVLVSFAGAAEPIFLLPIGPTPDLPPPRAILSLDGDALYVVSAKADAVLRDHPKGLVRVVKEQGPIRIRGKFVDGMGQTETRTYPGPFVFILEGVPGVKGQVEFDLIPLGLKAESEIVGVVLDVNGGAVPPIPDPKPKPDPKPDPAAKVAWIIVIEETLLRTDKEAAILVDEPMWRRIEAKGVKWRLYDKDAPEAKANKFTERVAGTPLPAVLLLDEKGVKIKVVPFPKSGADLESLTGGAK